MVGRILDLTWRLFMLPLSIAFLIVVFAIFFWILGFEVNIGRFLNVWFVEHWRVHLGILFLCFIFAAINELGNER